LIFWERLRDNRLIFAHRGNRSIRAENTLEAFSQSIGFCDAIELDVGFSKDGIPIIIHDDTLTRTTNIASLPQFTAPYDVISYTYEELQTLDASSWFIDDDPFDTIRDGVVNISTLERLPIARIPTLAQALELLNSNNIPVNVEIKDMTGTPFDATATKDVISVIQSLQMQDSILLSSFNHSYIQEAKTIDASITRAALQEQFHPKNLISYLKNLGVGSYNIDKDIATKIIIQKLKKAGITTNVFTVNNPADKERIFGYGARGIFTDFLS